MNEMMIAPCGMNCSLCMSHRVIKDDLKKQGFHKKPCEGCVPRGEGCLYMRGKCELLENERVRFCFECADYPCARLKALDKRYRTKYHMSMIENLKEIREGGIERFLEAQREKWRCKKCGGTICCHVGLCLKCEIEILKQNKRYRWGEQ